MARSDSNSNTADPNYGGGVSGPWQTSTDSQGASIQPVITLAPIGPKAVGKQPAAVVNAVPAQRNRLDPLKSKQVPRPAQGNAQLHSTFEGNQSGQSTQGSGL